MRHWWPKTLALSKSTAPWRRLNDCHIIISSNDTKSEFWLRLTFLAVVRCRFCVIIAVLTPCFTAFTSSGMDIERVNVVINYDCPADSDTYLHRIARAGRFGTKGLAVTFLASDRDSGTLNGVQDRFDITITELPDELDSSLYTEKTPDVTTEIV